MPGCSTWPPTGAPTRTIRRRSIGFQFRGFSLYGGLILALAAGALLSWALHLPLWKLADSAVPAIVAGVVLMRIGCFLEAVASGP